MLKPWATRNAADFTSLFQGAIRFNTYIGLAVASALFGDPGLVIAAIAVAIMIPLVNVLSVVTFSLAIDSNGKQPGDVLKGLLSNPLIVACLLGVALNISGVGLGGAWFGVWIEEFLARLGAAALPLGLLSVGVALSLGTVKRDWPIIVLASVLKFGVFPALMLSLAIWLQLDVLSPAGAAPAGLPANSFFRLYTGPATGRQCRDDGKYHQRPDPARLRCHPAVVARRRAVVGVGVGVGVGVAAPVAWKLNSSKLNSSVPFFVRPIFGDISYN